MPFDCPVDTTSEEAAPAVFPCIIEGFPQQRRRPSVMPCEPHWIAGTSGWSGEKPHQTRRRKRGWIFTACSDCDPECALQASAAFRNLLRQPCSSSTLSRILFPHNSPSRPSFSLCLPGKVHRCIVMDFGLPIYMDLSKVGQQRRAPARKEC